VAITRGRLADIQTVPSTAGSVYANPASTKTYIGGITLHNTSTTDEFVEVFCVPDSGGTLGTAALTNRFIAVTMAANDMIAFALPGDGIVLEDENDSIQARTTTASKVTIMLSGPKET
jgi:hypothetical protein